MWSLDAGSVMPGMPAMIKSRNLPPIFLLYKYTMKQCSEGSKAEECKRKMKGSGYTLSDSVRLSDADSFCEKMEEKYWSIGRQVDLVMLLSRLGA